ncbi:MAG TPA: hypothetical protein PLG17_09940 [Thermodesulfobacteriota bacterium]|nr:hypothetical protein [Thermodesulfobacteriota bacterium]
MINRYRHWLGEEARHMVETFDGDYVLYTDHLAAITEKDREIEQLEAENDNMRKIFDGLMAILPPEYFVKEDSHDSTV